MKSRTGLWLLVVILVLGISFRFYNLNWDSGQHLHPDERFLTMVAGSVNWPLSLAGYFSTAQSPLNPHNAGYQFYVYGTLPLFTVKAFAQLLHLADYNGFTVVGRYVSALLDSLTIILVFLISRHVSKSGRAGLFSALLYAVSVLPIQLAHFFAVDPFLVFFNTLSFFLLLLLLSSSSPASELQMSISLGLAYGLALSAKISAVLFLPVIILGFWFMLRCKFQIKQLFILGFLFLVSAFLTFRIFQPYAFTGIFTPNPDFISGLKTLRSYEDSSGWYPPSVQWINTPVWFSFENLFYWGLGPVLAVLALAASVYAFYYRSKYPGVLLVLIWIWGLFFYQSLQFTKPLRYFYPAYPFIAVISGLFLSRCWLLLRHIYIKFGILLLLIYWPVAFISIYTRPVTRIQATDWINQHIPSGSTLTCEYWDDCLPLSGAEKYQVLSLHLYDPESLSKWAEIQRVLARADYLILSSNRLYGSIMSDSSKYPDTTSFYRDLFSGKLGFKLVAQFTSRPNLPVPGLRFCITPPFISYGRAAFSLQDCPLTGISFVDDYADESFTVYDHPKVLIFQKTSDPGVTFIQ